MKRSSVTPPIQEELNLWLIDMDEAANLVDSFYPLLSEDEKARSARLIIPVVRNRFILARGAMRVLIADAVSCTPEALQFVYGVHGKPALRNCPDSGVQFNISHSAGMALLAVNRHCPVGVDIERVRPDRPFLKLSERFFSGFESAELASLPESYVMDGFYSCWTRKEAYLKAIGTGLATPLNAFDVTLRPEDAPALYGQRIDPDETSRWRIFNVEVPPGYRAAVATGWKSPEIIIRKWDPYIYPFLS